MNSKLQEILFQYNADGYIVLNGSDVRYFSKMIPDDTALLITKDDSYIISDSRYKYRIEAQSQFIPVVCKKNIYDEIVTIINEKGLKKVLISPSDITYSLYLDYFSSLSDKLIFEKNITRIMRMAKEEYELESVIQAQRISEKALSDILPSIDEGITTSEICAKLEYAMKLRGSEEPAFETIVLTGAATADCHGVPDNTKVKNGDFILFDFGSTVNGYRSDMTRTFAFGDISDNQRNIYNIVLEAHYAASKVIKEGIAAAEVDKAARKVISQKGYKKYFLHSTGHGVGLDIHEFPNVSEKSDAVLSKNMIITDEPGIYLNNLFGVRIEDMYLVGENSGYSLAKTEKKLINLK